MGAKLEEEDERRILNEEKQRPANPAKPLADGGQSPESSFLPHWAKVLWNFFLGLAAIIGGVTGPIAFHQSCETQSIEKRIAVEKLVNEALDYLGGKEGNPYLGTVGVSSCTVAREMDYTSIKRRRIQERQINLALRKITEALNRNADNPDAIRLRGVILHLSGQSEEAIREFERAIDHDPTNAKNFNALAIALLHLRHYDHAVIQLEKAVKLDPSAYLYNNLGMVYFAAEKFPDAFSCFKKAVQLDPEDSTHRCNLGAILDYMGKPEDAIEELSRAVFLDTKNSEAHFNSGIVRMKLGRIDEAITGFEIAIELDPTHTYAHFDLASCLLRKGKTEDAIKLLERIIYYIDPNYLPAYDLLASLYTGKRELEKANKLKQKATTIEKTKSH